MAGPTLGRFYTGKIRYLFYRRRSGFHSQFAPEGVKKISTFRHPGSNPGRPARSQALYRLRYLTHSAFRVGPMYNVFSFLNIRTFFLLFCLFLFNFTLTEFLFLFLITQVFPVSNEGLVFQIALYCYSNSLLI